MVMFSKAHGHVDEKVVKLFVQLEHGMNPVPAILAEKSRFLTL